MGIICKGRQCTLRYILLILSICLVTYLLTGSGSAEGFHNRLNHNMPRGAMSLDKMVDYLAAEDEFWNRLVNNPRLWAEKKASHASSQERHRKKRRMLKHYVKRGEDQERWDVVDRVVSSDLLSSDDEEMESNDNLLESFSSSSSSSTTTTTTTSTSSVSRPPKQRKPRKPNPTTPMHERCLKCRLYKYNEQCSLTMCKACCIASPSVCKYTHHKQAKVGARQPVVIASETTTPPPPILPVPNIKEQLEAIIQSKGEAFILYDRGTNSNRPRRIKPNAFSLGKEGELVHAYCYVAKDKRSFYLHHITRMEDHDWESINSIATPPPPVSISASSSTGNFISDFFAYYLIYNSRKITPSCFCGRLVEGNGYGPILACI